jgi:dihydropyrimidinase
MGYKGEEAKKVGLSTSTDDGYLYEGFERIGAIKEGMSIVHAENADLAERFCGKLEKSEDRLLAQWYDARPPICEEEAIRRAIFLADKARCPIYIAHVSSAAGVAALDDLKSKNVYAETCPHYLSLTKDEKLGVRGKVNPPLREKQDVNSLWKAIERGLIDTVGSDHVPHTLETKGSDFWKSPPGLTGIAVTLPLLLTKGVKKGRISASKVVEVCCANPAKIFGLYPRKGSLLVGSDADIVIVDFQKTKKTTAEILNSVSDFTPYEGMELQGWPTMTFKNGVKVMEQGEVLEKIVGKYIFR